MSLASCAPGTFSLPPLLGTSLLSVTTDVVSNYSGNLGFMPHAQSIRPQDLPTFCNVTVTYTHPGHNDAVNVQLWLPLPSPPSPTLPTWNRRYVSVGGAGFSAGTMGDDHVVTMLHRGFAVGVTDAGHYYGDYETADSWALVSPGNLNYPLFVSYASRATEELAPIGKALVEQFYGEKPRYSYWNGCSMGGRQGLLAAQRSPEEYDGILASCPSINVPELVLGGHYPGYVMDRLGAYPRECELTAITAAAVKACDGLDGVRDGVIADPDHCQFDPASMVGTSVDCDGQAVPVSEAAAEVARAAWMGATTSAVAGGMAYKKPLYYGLAHGAQLAGFMAQANTVCSSGDGLEDSDHSSGKDKDTSPPATTCTTAAPFSIWAESAKLFAIKDPSFNFSAAVRTQQDLEDFAQLLAQDLGGAFAAADPSLARLRRAGTKVLIWHATDDQAVSFRSSRDYYARVLAAAAAERGESREDVGGRVFSVL